MNSQMKSYGKHLKSKQHLKPTYVSDKYLQQLLNYLQNSKGYIKRWEITANIWK